ncbi:serine acetyltransferase [Winogradskyella sp. SYSU M77433]|uniref:serine O-acetyltransferase n=1 Tax=Winogradskyella sp. SYSU M77433 TaxID=3042722 RepID=UPI0024811053|nr:serine acetyltransferase [Winogradskyella sp. SYSU M77433]MDH7913957.1 serine acetyltransferase [Winogradskyella sp. SYSU M77433]
MINSKTDYKYYLNQDKTALGIKKISLAASILSFFSPNPIWQFQKTMRKLEYYSNCKNKGLYKIYILLLRYKYKKISLKLGFSIPINVFGPGLSIVHYGTIVINRATRVGKNCRMHACVNIGASGGSKKAPQLGDNVYIAPGAKIYGDITIADNTAISANAVVNKSFEEKSILLAGNPARKIKEIDITKIITYI